MLRNAIALWSACLAACGPMPGAARSERTVDLRPRLQRGVLYEILHRDSRAIEGEEPRVVRTRSYVQVTDVLPGGARRLRAHVLRVVQQPGEEARLVSSVVRFDLSPEGRIAADPQIECASGGADLWSGRFVRYTFDAHTVVREGAQEGRTWRTERLEEAIELASPRRYRIDALDHATARGRFATTVRMDQTDLGPLRVSGTGRVRGRFSIALDDGFSGTTVMEALVRGEVVDTSASRSPRAILRTQARILVRRVPPTVSLPECTPFDSSLVTRLIRTQLRRIQGCYESLLAQDPRMSGRVLARFHIDADGRFRGAHAIENSTGSDALAACVTDTLNRFRVREAPIGRVTYSYPFVFAPQN